ncbi:MAG TPA: hypothetical protein VFY71_10830 [Planctomycetota bacterium]|nr:hypothetical protein [Planctomycetota bacterium]
MNALALVFSLLLPLVPLLAVVHVVRHGPFRNRWWRGESVLGFAAAVGGAGFAAGFFGPLIVTPEANQGPLLGIFFTGPAGLLLGLVWGALRAAKRRREA